MDDAPSQAQQKIQESMEMEQYNDFSRENNLCFFYGSVYRYRIIEPAFLFLYFFLETPRPCLTYVIFNKFLAWSLDTNQPSIQKKIGASSHFNFSWWELVVLLMGANVLIVGLGLICTVAISENIGKADIDHLTI